MTNSKFVLLNVLLASFCINFTLRAEAKKKIDETWGAYSSAESQTFGDAEGLKKSKKMGIQATLAGATGLLGLNLNLNFTSDLEFSLGVGVSRGFRAFNTFVKMPFGGTNFSPYFVGGYSRWYSAGTSDGVAHTSPSVVENKFLSTRERETGNFAENIIYPGMGLQYLQLSGDLLGFGLFAELLMLVDIDDFVTAPTVGVGTNYYF